MGCSEINAGSLAVNPYQKQIFSYFGMNDTDDSGQIEKKGWKFWREEENYVPDLDLNKNGSVVVEELISNASYKMDDLLREKSADELIDLYTLLGNYNAENRRSHKSIPSESLLTLVKERIQANFEQFPSSFPTDGFIVEMKLKNFEKLCTTLPSYINHYEKEQAEQLIFSLFKLLSEKTGSTLDKTNRLELFNRLGALLDDHLNSAPYLFDGFAIVLETEMLRAGHTSNEINEALGCSYRQWFVWEEVAYPESQETDLLEIDQLFDIIGSKIVTINDNLFCQPFNMGSAYNCSYGYYNKYDTLKKKMKLVELMAAPESLPHLKQLYYFTMTSWPERDYEVEKKTMAHWILLAWNAVDPDGAGQALTQPTKVISEMAAEIEAAKSELKDLGFIVDEDPLYDVLAWELAGLLENRAVSGELPDLKHVAYKFRSADTAKKALLIAYIEKNMDDFEFKGHKIHEFDKGEIYALIRDEETADLAPSQRCDHCGDWSAELGTYKNLAKQKAAIKLIESKGLDSLFDLTFPAF